MVENIEKQDVSTHSHKCQLAASNGNMCVTHLTKPIPEKDRTPVTSECPDGFNADDVVLKKIILRKS
jgi:hypothetical protein